MRFFVGVHQPSDARHFDAVMVSVNRLRERKGQFVVRDWMMDSGAFTTIAKHGGYPTGVDEYAAQIKRWSRTGNMLCAVSQDYMCEQVMLDRTGLSVVAHQALTIRRFDELRACDTGGAYVMPVLQGYEPEDYIRHVGEYGDRLEKGAWVGVGSVCKRNGDPRSIERVLYGIKYARPDLRLHGFGLKSTALGSSLVHWLLDTADSMAWSFAARRQGRNPNDWREAGRFLRVIEQRPLQAQIDTIGASA